MSAPAWGHYADLRPRMIEAIRDRSPIAYVPWGALEWHSYHCPIGLDSTKATGLCEALAARTGGVILPPFYVGHQTIKPYKGFGMTLEYSEALLAMLCRETIEQLIDEQFRVIVILTGHYAERHVEVLKETGRDCAERFPQARIHVFGDDEPLAGLFPRNHAARGETSFQLLFAPKLVDLSLLPAGRVTTLDDDGVWGDDPREATAAEGERMRTALVENALPFIEQILEEVAS